MDYSSITTYCLDVIRNYLQQYITNTLIAKYGVNNYMLYLDLPSVSLSQMTDTFQMDSTKKVNKYDDALFYMNSFIKNWNNSFSSVFNSNYVLSLVYQLRYFRNRIAHQGGMTIRMIYRFVDSTQAFLEEINIQHDNQDIQRLEMVRKELMKIMLTCNDNIVVLGKAQMNDYSELNIEMKDDEEIVHNNYTMNGNNTHDVINNKKIEENYNKIMNGNDSNNFYKVSTFGDE
jgi:hypothetical protein